VTCATVYFQFGERTKGDWTKRVNLNLSTTTTARCAAEVSRGAWTVVREVGVWPVINQRQWNTKALTIIDVAQNALQVATRSTTRAGVAS
jgi:hypothetical protein